MPHETSIIYHRHKGEGSKDWDSSTYNMILVNETSQFIENHLQNNNDNPYIAYVPLGAVHEPHLPPDKYIDGSNVAGEYVDMLMEMNKTVGSLVGIIKDKGLAEDTIIIFGSDNGGLNPTFHPIQGKTVVVNLGIIQAVGYEAPKHQFMGVDIVFL